MLERLEREASPPTALVRTWVVAATIKTGTEASQTTRNRITVWSSNLTPRRISRPNCNSKRYTYPSVHSSTVHNSQGLEKTWMPINRWTDKDDVARRHNGTLFSHKKEQNHAICSNMGAWWAAVYGAAQSQTCPKRLSSSSNMEATRDYHTKWNTSERQMPRGNTYMWTLKYDTNGHIYGT